MSSDKGQNPGKGNVIQGKAGLMFTMDTLNSLAQTLANHMHSSNGKSRFDEIKKKTNTLLNIITLINHYTNTGTNYL